MRAAKPGIIRQINRAQVLQLLQRNGSVPRTEIARCLKLSKATITGIVSQLLSEDLVQEVGEGSSREQGGRKPILLTLNHDSRFVVGIDIGTKNIATGLASLKGDLKSTWRQPTVADHRVGSIVGQAQRAVEHMLADLNPSAGREAILAVGVAVPGTVRKTQGVVEHSYAFGWDRVELAAAIESALGVPAVIDNSTRVMALGEMWYGVGQGLRNVFFINVGNGIGSALIIHGAVFDNHSEFGHVMITSKKVPCNCGNLGCLEAVASGAAIERQAGKSIGSGPATMRGEELHAMARAGHPSARRIYRAAGKYIGRAASTIANTISPEKIIVGGGVSLVGELLLDPIREEYGKHVRPDIGRHVEILLSSLGTEAGLRGAVALAMQERVFQNEGGPAGKG